LLAQSLDGPSEHLAHERGEPDAGEAAVECLVRNRDAALELNARNKSGVDPSMYRRPSVNAGREDLIALVGRRKRLDSAHRVDKENDMAVMRRQAATMWILVSILVAGACSKESPAGDQKSDPAQPGSRPSAQSVPPGGYYEGFLDGVSCAGISGWAWMSSQPEGPLTINLYDGDRLLATFSADKLRQDLLDAGKGNGRHAFLEAVPLEIRDGKPHSIRAVVKDTSAVLAPWGSTPSSVTCAR
jgi:hypothetical protein